MPDKHFEQTKVISVGEMRKILKVSKETVHKLARTKKIPSQRTDAGWIFSEQDVREYQEYRLKKSKYDKRIQINPRKTV